MADIENNPVVQALAHESDIPYLNKAVVFLYTLHVCSNNKSRGNMIGRFASNMVRCFGAVGLVLPAILGGMPSEVFSNLDDYAYLVAAAMVVDAFDIPSYLPEQLQQFVDGIFNLAYAVVKGNAVAFGFNALQAVTGDSLLAPCAGAYLAVNGHRIIEKGAGALSDKLKGDQDVKLAVFGGAVYYFLTSGVLNFALAAVVVRAILVVLRFSNNYVDYDDMIEKVEGTLNNAAGSAGRKMRGRSKTPRGRK